MSSIKSNFAESLRNTILKNKVVQKKERINQCCKFVENELVKLMSNSDKTKTLQKLSWKNFEHSSKISSKKLDSYREKILFSYIVDN